MAVQASEQYSQGQLGIMQEKVKHISLLCLPRREYIFLKDFGLRDKLRKKHLHCLIISQHLKNAVGVCVLPVYTVSIHSFEVHTYFGLGEEKNTVSLVFCRSMGITIL